MKRLALLALLLAIAAAWLRAMGLWPPRLELVDELAEPWGDA